MKDLMKKDMDFLPALPMPVLPPDLPMLRYEDGIVRNWWHNKKLAQIEEMAIREANIYEANARKSEAQFKIISNVMLAGERMNSEKDRLRAEADLVKERVTELKMKNQLLYYEAKKAEMEYEAAKREM